MGQAKRRSAEIEELKKTPKPPRIGKPELRQRAINAALEAVGELLVRSLRPKQPTAHADKSES